MMNHDGNMYNKVLENVVNSENEYVNDQPIVFQTSSNMPLRDARET